MPEIQLNPADIARMIFPIDVAGIRAELARLLERPTCANFVRDLIDQAAANAAPGNTLVEDGDILRIYDLIQEQNGMVRAGAPGSIPGANFATGSIATEDAGIQIGNFVPGVPVTEDELKARYLRADTIIALHETIHHAGRLVFSDQDLAIVVSMMPGTPPIPQTTNRFAFSSYWDTELRRHCR